MNRYDDVKSKRNDDSFIYVKIPIGQTNFSKQNNVETSHMVVENKATPAKIYAKSLVVGINCYDIQDYTRIDQGQKRYLLLKQFRTWNAGTITQVTSDISMLSQSYFKLINQLKDSEFSFKMKCIKSYN
ncbi:Hypothetical_protein [Hexamita inflata]|uniref:Hypothetical_protein n=1 Tax=Hexamita inflata TaxID=28002 RepID=A0ABP1GGU3_9EUKA